MEWASRIPAMAFIVPGVGSFHVSPSSNLDHVELFLMHSEKCEG